MFSTFTFLLTQKPWNIIILKQAIYVHCLTEFQKGFPVIRKHVAQLYPGLMNSHSFRFFPLFLSRTSS